MPTLKLVTVGDPKGAEVVIKALRAVKVQALETDLTLKKVGKTRVDNVGMSRLEADVRKANSEINVLSQSLKTAAVNSDRLESEVAQLQTRTKSLTSATRKQTAASRSQIKTNSALRDSTRGVAGALGGLWFAYGQILPLMASFAVASSFRKGITEGAEFAQQMQFIKGVTDETAGAINNASVSILSMGESNLRGPVELAKGMRVLTKAGLDLESALTALQPVTNLSIVGELDMAKATRIATSAMNTFGKTARDLPNIVDVIGKASIISATEVGDLGNALSFMTGSVGLLKAELPEVAAQLAIAAQRGVTGSKAGTALNRAWLNLAAQAPKTKRALRELGAEVFDDTGQFRKMDAILGDLHKGLSRFTAEDQSNFIKAIFGVRSIKAIVPVIAEANNRLPRFRQEISEASEGIGTMGRIVGDLEDNLKGASQKTLSSFSSSLIAAFQSAEPAFTGIAEAFDRMFRTSEFKDFMSTVMRGLASTTQFMIEHRESIGMVLKAYLAFKVGGAVAGPVMAGFAAIAGPKGLIGVAKAGGTAALGLRALASAGLAAVGPAGWIALGVAGIVMLILKLRKLHSESKTRSEIFSEDVARNFENRLSRMTNKVQGLREELERLSEPDATKRDRSSLKDDLDRLLIVRDQLESRLSALRSVDGGRRDSVAEGLGLDTQRDKRMRVRRDLSVINKQIDTAAGKYRKFLALATQAGILKIERDAALAEQRGKGSSADPAGVLPEGTERARTFDLTKLKAEYANRLGALNSNLQTEKRLLGAYRSATLLDENVFIARSESLADTASSQRLSTIAEFNAAAIEAQKEGFEESGNIQVFINKLAVDAEKTRNKAILDERLALISELGKASKQFEKQSTQSATNINKFLGQQAKFDSTNFFGQVNSKDLADRRIKLLEDDVKTRLAIVNKFKLAQNANAEERMEFERKQTKARLDLHLEVETAKTTITREQQIERRKENIAGLKSLRESTSASLGAIADIIGTNSEKAFERSKRFRLAQAYMDTAAGAVGAFADTGGHIAIRIAAAVAAAAVGLARVQQIKQQTFSGQAHDGIASIPSTGSYLLDRDERVVKATDNKKLETFLNRDARGETPDRSGQAPIVVQFHVSALDGNSVNQFFVSNEGRIVGMVQKAYDQRLQPGGPIR